MGLGDLLAESPGRRCVPSYSSRVWRRRKSSKIRAWNLGSIPMPLSRTAIVVNPASAFPGGASTHSTSTRGQSERLYFSPFPIRFPQQLADPHRVPPDFRKVAYDLNPGAARSHELAEVGPDVGDHRLQFNAAELARNPSGPTQGL